MVAATLMSARVPRRRIGLQARLLARIAGTRSAVSRMPAAGQPALTVSECARAHVLIRDGEEGYHLRRPIQGGDMLTQRCGRHAAGESMPAGRDAEHAPPMADASTETASHESSGISR